MNEKRISLIDPYLAGAICARGARWWTGEDFVEQSAEEEADRLGVAGDRRAEFVRGFSEELLEMAREQAVLREQERTTYLDSIDRWVGRRGDPAS